jgi:N-acyl-D-aspartate/D-glutamate deacylase
MLDYLIQGGTLVDGTGTPRRRADVGVRDGRIVAVAVPAHRQAATGRSTPTLVVSPASSSHTTGAQLFWDPQASPSTVHGVTIAEQLRLPRCAAEQDADYLRRMMAGSSMPLPALENGVPWNWSVSATTSTPSGNAR